MSLRRRLLLGLLVVGAVLVMTNVTVSSRFRSLLLERVDSQLVSAASRPVFAADPGPRNGGRGGRPQPEDETLSEYFIAVSRNGGPLQAVSSALADADRPPPKLDADVARSHAGGRGRPAVPFTADSTSGSATWRLVAVDAGPGEVTVVGLSLDEVTSTLERIQLVQIAGTLAVLATIALVSWWMLRLGVHPIEEMAETADAIAAGDRSRRVQHKGVRTEADRLGVAINAMLERIEEAFREREQSEERVRRFAADASHELRTPLTSILGYAELWRAGGLRSESELAEAMRRTEQEGKRMAALVDDLLLLARLDQHQAPARSAVRLDEIATDAVRDASAVEPDRAIECDVQPATVAGDELQLRQVVSNLLENARVHTPPGTSISVRVSRNGGRVELEVSDQGRGMEPDEAKRVFERFYRADESRARNRGGTGLGLAIVEAIVSGHAGSVRVDTAPGMGARFVVDLPELQPVS